MVLTPQQAKKHADAKVNIEALEAKIDTALTEAAAQGDVGATIDADIFPNQRALALIKERYGAVGWAVTYHSDQREGSYVAFTPRKRPRHDVPDWRETGAMYSQDDH